MEILGGVIVVCTDCIAIVKYSFCSVDIVPKITHHLNDLIACNNLDPDFD